MQFYNIGHKANGINQLQKQNKQNGVIKMEKIRNNKKDTINYLIMVSTHYSELENKSRKEKKFGLADIYESYQFALQIAIDVLQDQRKATL
jgi:hypothetical protein